MRVNDVMKTGVVAIEAEADLARAANLMREQHVGFLVVVSAAPESGRGRVPVGVVTDRDIVVSVVARDISPATLTVRDVMTPNPLTVRESISIEEALVALREYGVRRAPVVSTGDTLVGVVSLDDLLDHLSAQLSMVAGAIRKELRVERQLRR